MRTAADTLKHWSTLGILGSENMVRVGSALWFWSVAPRAQKNGALVGEVHSQEPGENPRYVGIYKIAADGEVETIPEALAGILVTPPRLPSDLDMDVGGPFPIAEEVAS